MTIIDVDIPGMINTLDMCQVRLKQSRGENTTSRQAGKYVDDVMKDLDALSDWFREQLVNIHD